MGGYGGGKGCVEDYPKTLNIKFLKKYGYLDTGVDYKKGGLSWWLGGKENGNIGIEVTKGSINGFVRVFFTQTSYNGEKESFDYQIPLVSTPCNYGGVRRWLLCPCKSNRCSILYLQNNGIFASRKTLDLCYDEQKKSKRRRYLGYIMGDAFTKIELIRRTMKYPVRNGKYTKKAQRILRLQEKMPSIEEIENFSFK